MKYLAEATQPERRDYWNWKPGSGSKVHAFNFYSKPPPEPQAPFQHLPRPCVSFLQLHSLAREGLPGWLVSYHWASRHLRELQVVLINSSPSLGGK